MGKLPAKDRFQLLALSCILIASKYLGPEEEVPPISEFWEFGNRCYSYEEIHEMELLTLTKYVARHSFVRHAVCQLVTLRIDSPECVSTHPLLLTH